MSEKLVDAIVRGPMPYFGADGVLYVPGQVVRGVPAEDVGEDATRKIDAEFEAANGDLRTRKVDKAMPFAPIGSEPSVAGEVTTATAATGQPDRLNVTDFLKGSDEAVIESIRSGSVDDHLGVIEQALIAGKGKPRDAVRTAVSARLGDLRPVR